MIDTNLELRNAARIRALELLDRKVYIPIDLIVDVLRQDEGEVNRPPEQLDCALLQQGHQARGVNGQARVALQQLQLVLQRHLQVAAGGDVLVVAVHL